MEAIGAAVVLLLALIGLAFLIRLVYLWLLLPRSCGRRALLVFLSGNQPEPELRGLLEFYRFIGSRFFCRICLVDAGLTEDAAEACRIFCRENDSVSFCDPTCAKELLKEEGSILHGEFQRNRYHPGERGTDHLS